QQFPKWRTALEPSSPFVVSCRPRASRSRCCHGAVDRIVEAEGTASSHTFTLEHTKTPLNPVGPCHYGDAGGKSAGTGSSCGPCGPPTTVPISSRSRERLLAASRAIGTTPGPL